jgi:hypothetical protein
MESQNHEPMYDLDAESLRATLAGLLQVIIVNPFVGLDFKDTIMKEESVWRILKHRGAISDPQGPIRTEHRNEL